MRQQSFNLGMMVIMAVILSSTGSWAMPLINEEESSTATHLETRSREMSQNMELMGNIAREIINCGRLDNLNWIEVSAIFVMDPDGDVSESYGYAYDTNGKVHAAAFLYDGVEREVKTYREWLRKPGDKGIIKMLFQFNRVTRQVKADFEYDDPTRWQVTPKNIDTIIEELRPNLAE